MVILPKSKLGKFSIILIGIFFLMLGIFQAVVAMGYRGGDTFFSNPPLAILAIVMGVSGICAFFTGIAGIIRQKERAVLVFISTLLGLFILIFILGEFISPH